MMPFHVLREHSLSLVAIAGLLCVAGGWATSRFFQRMSEVRDSQRYAWLFLTSLASGVTIWCTHFVAMLGYHPGVGMSFGWLLTGVSLLIAVAGSALGFLVASGDGARPALGGVLVGLSVASMHYVGMSAMRMQGTVTWNGPLVALSVALGVVLAAVALHAARAARRPGANLMWALFVASVLLLHFTGMSAMQVGSRMPDMPGMPGMDMGMPTDPQDQYVLAVAVAAMSFVTIGAGVVGYLIDGRTRSRAIERFRRMAMHDALTGLPNRMSLTERLDVEIGRGERLALVVVDVDNFKEINDLRGHMVGDEVLAALGARLRALAHDEGQFIARIGGDEFVALCRLGDADALPHFLDRLRRAVSGIIHVDSEPIVARASIGVAVFPDDATDAQTLFNNADLAMYRAKADPLHDVRMYDAAVDERTRLRRGLTADLREAVERGEMFLHYQVQTSVATGEILGYEALLRWQHPQLGAVSPAEFIPLAEDSGLIVPIGEWVLRTACAEAATWEPPYRLSVNVSAVQLAEEELADTVREILEQSGLPADRLELEMTETAVFADRDHALRALREVKAMGVRVALDDYGVGYSSLDVLRSFPFDRIKIDRSFFSGANTPAQTLELISAVLSLGRTFGMSVLAEGIETDAQLALLTEAGCDEAQGFLFGRPTPLEEIVRSGQLSLTETAGSPA